MENPFFKSHWGYPPRRPRYDPNGWELPVKSSNTTSRVVNIPVRFVGSERSELESAVKIQKLVRGFLVRKSVKKILAMRREVDGIQRKLQEREFVELIGSNAKERLKVNEILMNLLFKLDSVRGLDSGVRDCRKEVIKKVIALQEKVDAIVAEEKAAGAVIRTPAAENEDAAAEMKVSEESEKHSSYFSASEQQQDDAVIKSKENRDSLANEMEDADSVETMANRVESDATVFSEHTSRPDEMNQPQPMDHSMADMKPETDLSAMEDPVISGNADIVNGSEINEVEEVERVNELISSNLTDELAELEMSTENEQRCLKLGSTNEFLDAGTESEFISTEMKETESQSECSQNLQISIEEEAEKMEGTDILQSKCEENNRIKELLQRMEEENGRMIGLMAEMLEKNETQNRLLNSLSERVEYLEKTITSEKLRKKKRRNAVAATLDCSAKRRENKKCGKKV